MIHACFFILGAAISATVLSVCYLGYLHRLRVQRERVRSWDSRLKTQAATLKEHARLTAEKLFQAEKASSARIAQINAEIAQRERECSDAIEEKRRLCNGSIADAIRDIQHRQEEAGRDIAQRTMACNESVAARTREIDAMQRKLSAAVTEFESRKVKYESLLTENTGLKQDCFNLAVKAKKMELDQAAFGKRQEELHAKADEIASRYLKESVSWIGGRLNSNNFSGCKQRLLNVIAACRSIGFYVAEEEEANLIAQLQKDFEQAVRDEFAREEQSRIKAQIREEERLAREMDKQIKDAEREKAAIEAALEKALKEAKDEHSAEVELLKTRLKEAEEKAEHAISQAQLTKAGHVYVLSNIGSFGEGVFKIGMTRRLDPQERVSELSSASVPFPYDVHMMISCDNAPALENALHRELHKQRVNKVNLRKEFFKIDLERIRQIVESQHGTVDYRAEPEALQYRETLNMPEEDFAFIGQTAESVMGNENGNSFSDEE